VCVDDNFLQQQSAKNHRQFPGLAKETNADVRESTSPR
jgi:hypothetical protein